MKVCVVKDQANKESTLVSRVAPHHVVSEQVVAHDTPKEMMGASLLRRSYWRLFSDLLLEEEG
jgi:hypothetical protein